MRLKSGKLKSPDAYIRAVAYRKKFFKD